VLRPRTAGISSRSPARSVSSCCRNDPRILIDAILDFVATDGLLARVDIRAALQREIDAAGTESLRALEAQLGELAVARDRPIAAERDLSAAGDRRAAVDAIGRAIAALPPPAYRGVYGP
jgi:hypothetical protein